MTTRWREVRQEWTERGRDGRATCSQVSVVTVRVSSGKNAGASVQSRVVQSHQSVVVRRD